jgi:hypothetical protein
MWVKLDDGILDDPKIVAIGPTAFALFVGGLIYCGRNLTNGFIPKRRLKNLVPWDIPASTLFWCASKLCLMKLWRKCDGGYNVARFLRYNPSKSKVLRSRQHTAQRVSAFRARHHGNGVSNAAGNAAPVPTRPVPKDIKEPPLAPPRGRSDFSHIGEVLRTLPNLTERKSEGKDAP